MRGQDSEVGIVQGYGKKSREQIVLFRARVRVYSLLRSIYNIPRAQPASYSVRTDSIYSGGNEIVL
jgi:hypothetical protein